MKAEGKHQAEMKVHSTTTTGALAKAQIVRVQEKCPPCVKQVVPPQTATSSQRLNLI